ncbi:MAG: cytochrome c [Burkholderiales bacterium]|nr:MAG: cytochrome c [Burkholderiales bacterium]
MNRFSFLGISVAAALVAAFAWPLAGHAQFAKVEDAIKYRKAVMTLQSAHLGRVFAVVKGSVPYDAAQVQANADLLGTLVTLAWPAFVAGSDKGDTRALPAIWSEPDKFKAAIAQLQERVGALQAAARSGDLDQVKAAAGPVGQSCKGCHDNFRRD